jgi:polyphosphate kinase 2 (PPK2 family)
VFPNPTKEVLNIRIPDALLEREIQGISLYNANGEQLHHANQFEPMIDVKGINAGTYFLELKTKNQSIVKKIVIH